MIFPRLDWQRARFEPCAEVGACAKGLRWFLACGILMQMRTLLQVRPNTIAFDSEAREIHGNSLFFPLLWELNDGLRH